MTKPFFTKIDSSIYTILYSVTFLLGVAWVLFLLFQSPGTPVQDEIGHYLISKNAWVYPQLILNGWGRTVNTLIYMLPALDGLIAARIFSVFLAALTVFLTSLVAKQIGLQQIFWIPLFLWFQPWFGDLSYSMITEVPFSLFLILGIYLWLRGNFLSAGFAFGLLPLIRHEGILLLGIWCFFAIFSKAWKAILVSVLPMILYNVLFYLVFDRVIAGMYINLKPTDLYGQGSWFHFVQPVLKNAGWPAFLFALLSIFTVWKFGRKALFFLLYAAYFIIHTIIYRYGLFGSGGYYLFLLPLAPGIALASAIGCEWASNQALHIFGQLRSKSLHSGLTALCVFAVFSLVIITGFSVNPRPADVEQIASQEAAQWLKERNHPVDNVISTHVWFYYYFQLPLVDGILWTSQPALENIQTGSLVVWDKHYSDRWGLSLSKLSDPSNGWQRLAGFQKDFIIIFQKQ